MDSDAACFAAEDAVDADKPLTKVRLKICVCGNSVVGKSSLVTRFTEDYWHYGTTPTVGADFKQKQFILDFKDGSHPPLDVQLQLWDTAGQERFVAITKNYFRKCHGVLFVYGYDDAKSLHSIKYWAEMFEQNYSPASEGDTVPKYILANKWDLPESEWATTPEEGMQMAINMELPWRQVSAKTGFQVDEAITDMCRDIVNNRLNYTGQNRFSTDKPRPAVHLAEPPRRSSNDCFKELLRRVQFFGCGVSAKARHHE